MISLHQRKYSSSAIPGSFRASPGVLESYGTSPWYECNEIGRRVTKICLWALNVTKRYENHALTAGAGGGHPVSLQRRECWSAALPGSFRASPCVLKSYETSPWYECNEIGGRVTKCDLWRLNVTKYCMHENHDIVDTGSRGRALYFVTLAQDLVLVFGHPWVLSGKPICFGKLRNALAN